MPLSAKLVLMRMRISKTEKKNTTGHNPRNRENTTSLSGLVYFLGFRVRLLDQFHARRR